MDIAKSAWGVHRLEKGPLGVGWVQGGKSDQAVASIGP